MTTTKSWKPALLGAGAGALAVSIIGFSWAGWVTASKAEVMAAERASTEVVAALTPLCIAQARADPGHTAKLVELKEASRYQRSQILADSGWATLPGSDEPNRRLANACALELIAGP